MSERSRCQTARRAAERHERTADPAEHRARLGSARSRHARTEARPHARSDRRRRDQGCAHARARRAVDGARRRRARGGDDVAVPLRRRQGRAAGADGRLGARHAARDRAPRGGLACGADALGGRRPRRIPSPPMVAARADQRATARPQQRRLARAGAAIARRGHRCPSRRSSRASCCSAASSATTRRSPPTSPPAAATSPACLATGTLLSHLIDAAGFPGAAPGDRLRRARRRGRHQRRVRLRPGADPRRHRRADPRTRGDARSASGRRVGLASRGAYEPSGGE